VTQCLDKIARQQLAIAHLDGITGSGRQAAQEAVQILGEATRVGGDRLAERRKLEQQHTAVCA
jgi:hypothetical protein